MTEYHSDNQLDLKQVHCKLMHDERCGQYLVLGEGAIPILRLRSDGCIELRIVASVDAKNLGLCLDVNGRVTVCHA